MSNKILIVNFMSKVFDINSIFKNINHLLHCDLNFMYNKNLNFQLYVHYVSIDF